MKSSTRVELAMLQFTTFQSVLKCWVCTFEKKKRLACCLNTMRMAMVCRYRLPFVRVPSPKRAKVGILCSTGTLELSEFTSMITQRLVSPPTLKFYVDVWCPVSVCMLDALPWYAQHSQHIASELIYACLHESGAQGVLNSKLMVST